MNEKDIVNLKIFFVGSGKIAHSLAPEFKKYCEIIGVCDLVKERAVELSEKYKVPFYEAISLEAIEKSNFIIIAASDDKIEEVANQIASYKTNFDKKMFLHLSGSKTSESLRIISNLGAMTASFHIVQTFPNYERVSIKNCPCAIETDNEIFYEILKSFARKFDLKYFRVKKENKIFYHMSAVFCSNLLCSLMKCSKESFNKAEIKEISFEELFYSLTLKSLQNIFEYGEAGALSGPIERGDIKTISNHIDVLSSNKYLRNVYITLSLIALQIAREKNFKDEKRQMKYHEIEEYLNNLSNKNLN